MINEEVSTEVKTHSSAGWFNVASGRLDTLLVNITSEESPQAPDTEQTAILREKVREIDDLGVRISAAMGINAENVARYINRAYSIPDDVLSPTVDTLITNYEKDFTIGPVTYDQVTRTDVKLMDRFREKRDFVIRLAHLGGAVHSDPAKLLMDQAAQVSPDEVAEMKAVYRDHNAQVDRIEKPPEHPRTIVDAHLSERRSERRRKISTKKN